MSADQRSIWFPPLPHWKHFQMCRAKFTEKSADRAELRFMKGAHTSNLRAVPACRGPSGKFQHAGDGDEFSESAVVNRPAVVLWAASLAAGRFADRCVGP